ncbi:uncharacterized protein MEPE_03393 [Melanopsichium pennsylvanicum]|uniref:Uncharacterized protein n=1 Tax=Melanopsichium pennsylvanicum TaxID=63383 RepID=A0AAJ4XKX6_9BASI|nr:uncharacterized protein MEPE_03393 [Melanopsichium pennsylvanicum]
MLSHRISADSTSLVCADLFLGTHSRDTMQGTLPATPAAPLPQAEYKELIYNRLFAWIVRQENLGTNNIDGTENGPL